MHSLIMWLIISFLSPDYRDLIIINTIFIIIIIIIGIIIISTKVVISIFSSA